MLSISDNMELHGDRSGFRDLRQHCARYKLKYRDCCVPRESDRAFRELYGGGEAISPDVRVEVGGRDAAPTTRSYGRLTPRSGGHSAPLARRPHTHSQIPLSLPCLHDFVSEGMRAANPKRCSLHSG